MIGLIGPRGVGKVDNTNLIYNLAKDTSNIGNIRETFFLNQMRIFECHSFVAIRDDILILSAGNKPCRHPLAANHKTSAIIRFLHGQVTAG